MSSSILPHYAFPYEDEFAASFLLRTSYVNGYQSPKAMLNNFGILVYNSTLESIFCNEEKFLYILKKFGLPTEFTFLVLKKAPPTNQFFYLSDNISISKKLIDFSLTKFCPQCLQEFGYWKKEWLFKPMFICKVHQIKMFNNCPKCNNTLILNRTSLFICSYCNFDLRNSEKLKINNDEENKIQWLLKISQNDFINKEYLVIWEAIQKYYENLKIKTTNSIVSELCYLFFQDIYTFIIKMTEILTKNMNLNHPKIQVLPFLKVKGKLKNTAYEILKNIKTPTKPSKDLIFKTLNRSEAALILGLSTSTLSLKLEKKILFHNKILANGHYIFDTKILEDWLIYPEKYYIKKEYWKKDDPSIFFDTYDLSCHYNIDYETARKFLKTPSLQTTIKNFNRVRKKCILKKNIEKFDKKFIFLITLAKDLNIAHTYLQDKLSGVGIKIIPESKNYVPYYLRENIRNITKEQLDAVTFHTNKRGRKPLGEKNKIYKYREDLNLNEASKILDISPLQVAKLIQYNFLPVKDIQTRPHVILKRDLLYFLNKINHPSYISLDSALKLLNCTYREFEKRWVVTGIAKIRDLRYWKSVSLNQIYEIKEISKNYFTANEANEFLGMHRTYITNLVTMNIIKPWILGNDKHSIRLFKKSDVIALLQRGFGKPIRLHHKS
jgi:hypothetical protein